MEREKVEQALKDGGEVSEEDLTAYLAGITEELFSGRKKERFVPNRIPHRPIVHKLTVEERRERREKNKARAKKRSLRTDPKFIPRKSRRRGGPVSTSKA